MRRHLILFFSALFLFISCKDSGSAGDVIEKDKMVKILCDLHIIDGTMTSYGAKDSLYKYGTNRYSLLFKKYGIDSALFNKSLKYYTSDPDEIVKMYEQVENILKTKNDSISKIQAKIAEREMKKLEAKGRAEKRRKADSLRRDSIKRSAKPIQLKLNKRIQ
jgi:hypothetical protein